VSVRTHGDEQCIGLREGERATGAGDRGHHQHVEIVCGRRRSDFGARLEREQRGHAGKTEVLPIAVHGAEHEGERSVRPVGHGHRQWRVHGQPNARARERDARREVHRGSIQRGAQSPRDAAQSDRVANVEHRLAKAVLQVLQMVRGDTESIHELRTSIVRHAILRDTAAR